MIFKKSVLIIDYSLQHRYYPGKQTKRNAASGKW